MWFLCSKRNMRESCLSYQGKQILKWTVIRKGGSYGSLWVAHVLPLQTGSVHIPAAYETSLLIGPLRLTASVFRFCYPMYGVNASAG